MPRIVGARKDLYKRDRASQSFNARPTSGKRGGRRIGKVMPVGRRPKRGYRYRVWLGPLGPLGEATVMYVKLKPWATLRKREIIGTRGLMQYISKKGKRVTQHDLNQSLRSVQMRLINYLTYHIRRIAPKETGALRRAMVRSLGSVNYHYERGFHTKLGTPQIFYAKPVNKMSQKTGHRVAHREKKRWDPDAQYQYFDLLLLKGRQKAVALMREEMRKIGVDLFKMGHVFHIEFFKNVGRRV